MRRVLLSMGAFLLLAACGAGAPTGTSSVTLLDGTPASLEELSAEKPAVVNFWAASCSFCKDELPLFEKISHTFPEVTVIGVNLQEDANDAAAYWHSGGYTFSTLLDPSGTLKKRFDIFTRPTTVFLDASGKIVSRKNGALLKEELEQRVVALLEEDIGLQQGGTERIPQPLEDELPTFGTMLQVGDAKKSSPVPHFLQGWYGGGSVAHSIPFAEILRGGPSKDGIPSLDSPAFLPADEVEFLDDDDVGVLLSINDSSRFYPYKILNWHEIVNDTVGGEPVSVTYCPLCATAVVYSRQASGGSTTFGISGFLYQSNLLMYDRVTDSLWNQVTGKAVVGERTGEVLTRVRSDVVRYGTAKKTSPELLVLSAETGYLRDYTRDPYEGYDSSATIMFSVRASDDRLHPKALVYGVSVGGVPIAFYKESLVKSGALELHLENDAVVRATYNSATEQVGVTVRSPGEGEEGAPVIPVPAFWFSWVAMYPETLLME